eukprot:CAMPEP_0197564258 /NCGR_PEP_ID=MMETSP1320-20131121/30147_1 /TAXON_ID=91990 /ORGANISM="Bolidomonas sp., Strain RCC2347" /LENGTH=235 /DNA_ID=CAMNT_0043126159 /DNA_START=94 /DNA_END=797 /DNA_ORIENTATION=-
MIQKLLRGVQTRHNINEALTNHVNAMEMDTVPYTVPYTAPYQTPTLTQKLTICSFLNLPVPPLPPPPLPADLPLKTYGYVLSSLLPSPSTRQYVSSPPPPSFGLSILGHIASGSQASEGASSDPFLTPLYLSLSAPTPALSAAILSSPRLPLHLQAYSSHLKLPPQPALTNLLETFDPSLLLPSAALNAPNIVPSTPRDVAAACRFLSCLLDADPWLDESVAHLLVPPPSSAAYA